MGNEVIEFDMMGIGDDAVDIEHPVDEDDLLDSSAAAVAVCASASAGKFTSPKEILTLNLTRRSFVCAKEGFRVDKEKPGRDGRVKRPRAETRVGCKAMLVVKIQDSSRWVVSGFVKEHNHELVPLIRCIVSALTAMFLGDEDQCMSNIFWADPKARMNYTYFGDTVTFDTTYRSNLVSVALCTLYRSEPSWTACVVWLCPPNK
ncbi:Protein FAR1-related sequence 5 [Vitis vinifera]|uniref:Protein FAR1-related sequence 5 n=1 Tax=Vitis vinifera TaxID=29760 RepID=A0A438H3K7_VITVI|nr:Protein FAR1-related sequence 5 [Vitis vinifera]